MHKNPIGFRTITFGYNIYVVNPNLKLVKNLNFNVKPLFKDYNCTVINNIYSLIKKIKMVNNCYNISAYDFNALFNSINLDDLFEVMMKFYDSYNIFVVDRSNYENILRFVLL